MPSHLDTHMLPVAECLRIWTHTPSVGTPLADVAKSLGLCGSRMWTGDKASRRAALDIRKRSPYGVESDYFPRELGLKAENNHSLMFAHNSSWQVIYVPCRYASRSLYIRAMLLLWLLKIWVSFILLLFYFLLYSFGFRLALLAVFMHGRVDGDQNNQFRNRGV